MCCSRLQSPLQLLSSRVLAIGQGEWKCFARLFLTNDMQLMMPFAKQSSRHRRTSKSLFHHLSECCICRRNLPFHPCSVGGLKWVSTRCLPSAIRELAVKTEFALLLVPVSSDAPQEQQTSVQTESYRELGSAICSLNQSQKAASSAEGVYTL